MFLTRRRIEPGSDGAMQVAAAGIAGARSVDRGWVLANSHQQECPAPVANTLR